MTTVDPTGWDREAYNALLKGLVRQRNFRSAEALLDTMRMERLSPWPGGAGKSWDVMGLQSWVLNLNLPESVIWYPFPLVIEPSY